MVVLSAETLQAIAAILFIMIGLPAVLLVITRMIEAVIGMIGVIDV